MSDNRNGVTLRQRTMEFMILVLLLLYISREISSSTNIYSPDGEAADGNIVLSSLTDKVASLEIQVNDMKRIIQNMSQNIQSPIPHNQGKPPTNGNLLGVADCTVEQMEVISRVINGADALMNGSSCPDTDWLRSGSSWLERGKRDATQPLISIYGGCNKAFDAVDTLRWLSHNDSIQLPLWRPEWPNAGACKQGDKEQAALDPKQSVRPAHVFCIEAVPKTYRHLKELVQKFQWHNSLHMYQKVLTDIPGGTVAFPNGGLEGAEYWSLENCKWTKCEEVPRATIDSFISDQQELNELRDSSTLIDVLSIDTEGQDWRVLQGSKHTLQRTKYVEFEYHNKHVWIFTPLGTAIKFLSGIQFRCYWAWSGGLLWRITGCFRNQYDKRGFKNWSNVVCVNVRLAPDLAETMERKFLEAVSKHGQE